MPPNYFTSSDRALLIRLDEKFQAIQSDIVDLKNEITQLKNHAENHLVTQKEFAPVKQSVYAAIGIILTGVMGAILMLILKGSP
jgi:hypothetical protein